MWRAWTTARRWRKTPSEVYGIHDELSAYCFDNAVSIFGLALTEAMREASKGAKTDEESRRRSDQVLQMWLTDTNAIEDIRNNPDYRMPKEWV